MKPIRTTELWVVTDPRKGHMTQPEEVFHLEGDAMTAAQKQRGPGRPRTAMRLSAFLKQYDLQQQDVGAARLAATL